MDILNPEFIVSTGTGAGVVWAVVKTHLHYMSKELKRHDDEIEKIYAILYRRRENDKEVKL